MKGEEGLTGATVTEGQGRAGCKAGDRYLVV